MSILCPVFIDIKLSFIITLIVTLLIGMMMFGLPQKEKSEWEQLTKEEQEQIEENMEFYDAVQDAAEDYQKSQN